MQIDFRALEQALAPIEQIGQAETTFSAGATTITLRVPLPSEEVEAQKYATIALNEGDEGEHSAVDYLDRFRIAMLSHGLVAVGDSDFRNIQYVETGEVLGSGVAVKVPRYKAMRDLLQRWNRTTLTMVFHRFTDLLFQAEAEAEKQIEYLPSNIPTEIERLQRRIVELEEKMNLEKEAEKAKVSSTVAALAPAEAPQPTPQPAPQEEPEEPPAQVLSPVHRRTGPITPQAAPPPPQSAPAPAQSRAPRSGGSFINMDDDGLDAALDAEHNRLAEMRRKAEAAGTLERQPARRPPHFEAAAVEAEVRATEIGELDGVPVFALPGQSLETPQARSLREREVLNPKLSGVANRNPRFQSPPKP